MRPTLFTTLEMMPRIARRCGYLWLGPWLGIPGLISFGDLTSYLKLWTPRQSFTFDYIRCTVDTWVGFSIINQIPMTVFRGVRGQLPLRCVDFHRYTKFRNCQIQMHREGLAVVPFLPSHRVKLHRLTPYRCIAKFNE